MPPWKSFRHLRTRFFLELTFRWRRTASFFLRILPKAIPASRPPEPSFRRSLPDAPRALRLSLAPLGLRDSYPFFRGADSDSRFSARFCSPIRSSKPIEISRRAKSRDSRFFSGSNRKTNLHWKKLGFRYDSPVFPSYAK